MSKILRALLISAVATGAAAAVLKLLQPAAPTSTPRRAGPYVEADALTEAEQDALLRELDAQL